MKKIVNLMIILSICGLNANDGAGQASAFKSFVNSFRSFNFSNDWNVKGFIPTWDFSKISMPKVSIPEIKFEDVQKHQKEIGLGFGILAGIGLLRKAYVHFYKKPEISYWSKNYSQYDRINAAGEEALQSYRDELRELAKNGIDILPTDLDPEYYTFSDKIIGARDLIKEIKAQKAAISDFQNEDTWKFGEVSAFK